MRSPVLAVAVLALASGAACGGSSSAPGGGTPPAPVPSALPGVVEYVVADANTYAYGWQIAQGPAGNVWFAGETVATVGYVAPNGAVTRVALPATAGPMGVVTGLDGNLWYSDEHFKIGRVTPTGEVTVFDVPAPFGRGWGLTRITRGPDGNLWFVGRGIVGRITTEGVITEFPITVERAAGTWVGTPWDITTGPDGNLWFTDMEFNQIGRITPSGAIQTFAVPGAMLSLEGITAGPDGNVWFTDGLSRAIPPVGGNRIGRITPDGVVTMFPVPTANSLPGTITTGPDGNLWFVEQFAGQVGRITPAGVVTEFALPPPPRKSNPSRTPLGITAGVDGKMWFSTVGSLATVGHFQP